MSCYQQRNAELPMSDKTRADEGSSTNDNELSLDELKAVSGAGVDFNEPYSDVPERVKGEETNSTVQIGLQDNSSAPRSRMDSTGDIRKIKFQDT